MSENDSSESEQEHLEAEAVRWVVRLRSGETTESDHLAAQAWGRTSEAHQRAFEKACRLWNGMDALRSSLDIQAQSGEVDNRLLQKSSSNSFLEESQQDMPKGRRLKMAAAAMAALGLAFLLHTQFFTNWRADISTGTGEQVVREFADGSVVQLNTQAAMNLHYSPTRRRVDLLAGEAAFRVAKDSSRPFIVWTNYGTIRAIGTEFLVYKTERSLLVTVLEGLVDVSVPSRQGGPDVSARLGAGQQVRFARDSGLAAVERVDLRMVTAWQRGRLVFEAAPLNEVVKEINRYRPGYIVLLNDRLRQHKVNGVFDLERLNDAVATIERTLPVTSLHLSDRFIFLQ